jgi:hypothetical protein
MLNGTPSAALVKLATQFTVAHIKLEHRVTRRQSHLFNLAGIPRRHDVPTRIRIFFDLCDHVVNLIERTAVGGFPICPLRAIDAAEIAVGVCPFVPDRHAVVAEIFDVRLAAQKPEQFVGDGFEVDFFRGDERKIFLQRKPRLRAEHGKRARARAVGLELPVVEDVPQQIEVLNHRAKNLTTKRAPEKEI